MTKPAAGVTGTALVVADWLTQELREVAMWQKQQHPNMKVASGPEVKKVLAAALAGREAGQRVSLADQIERASQSPIAGRIAR